MGSPKPNNSRHLKAPEHFQNCLPPSTAGDASFFRSGSGEGLSEPVMEFPVVLGAFLKRAPIKVLADFLSLIHAQTVNARNRTRATAVSSFVGSTLASSTQYCDEGPEVVSRKFGCNPDVNYRARSEASGVRHGGRTCIFVRASNAQIQNLNFG